MGGFGHKSGNEILDRITTFTVFRNEPSAMKTRLTIRWLFQGKSLAEARTAKDFKNFGMYVANVTGIPDIPVATIRI